MLLRYLVAQRKPFLVHWWQPQSEMSVFLSVNAWNKSRLTSFGHLFDSVAVSCFANVLFSAPHTHTYSPTTSNKKNVKARSIWDFFLLGICWLWHKNSYNFLCTSLKRFILNVVLRESEDAGYPVKKPKLLQTFISKVKIAAIACQPNDCKSAGSSEIQY